MLWQNSSGALNVMNFVLRWACGNRWNICASWTVLNYTELYWIILSCTELSPMFPMSWKCWLNLWFSAKQPTNQFLSQSKFVIKCRPVAISFILGNFDNIFPLKCCHSEPLFENLPTFSSPETTFDEFRHLFVVCFAKNRSFWQQVSHRWHELYPIKWTRIEEQKT